MKFLISGQGNCLKWEWEILWRFIEYNSSNEEWILIEIMWIKGCAARENALYAANIVLQHILVHAAFSRRNSKILTAYQFPNSKIKNCWNIYYISLTDNWHSLFIREQSFLFNISTLAYIFSTKDSTLSAKNAIFVLLFYVNHLYISADLRFFDTVMGNFI